MSVWFDHIAIGVPLIEDVLPFVVGELGGRPAGGGLTRAFAFRQWHFGGGKLEILEPAGAPGGFLHRFLERRGPGVHHVTLEVPDLDATCARAEAMGFTVVERDDSDPEWSEAFLHPKSAMSIVVQMAQVRRPQADAHELPIVAPDPGDPEPGALGIELIGLRLAASSLRRAHDLWCDLLGGIGRSIDGALEVRWPGSPMRLVVQRTAPGADEGPVAIEIACLRPAVVPVGPHPVLGTAFETVDITALPPPASEGEPLPAIAALEPLGEAAGADDDTYFLDADTLELEDRERS
jgi:catechol 2,3-dioxygenase-like lactoylglutathione lyase family enzyme